MQISFTVLGVRGHGGWLQDWGWRSRDHHTHTALTLHPLTACPPWGERPPPDLLQQGGQREFNTRVPHSSKVIIDVAAGRGSPGAG